jgi:4-hydroxy-tetrahydrodipicolinate synthase
MKKLSGIFPVPVTPFKKTDQSVDYETLEAHVESLLSCGIHGVVANGSTSETALLSDEEYVQVAKTVITKVDGTVPVVIGTTAPSTWKTLEYCKMGEDLGADAYLMLPPYFFPAGEAEIIKHYETVASQTRLPIVLYNNPGTCGIDLTPRIVSKLAEIESIKYIKEATGEVARIYEIKELAGDKIEVLCGSDNILLDALLAGAIGAVAASGNVVPSQMVQIYRLVIEEKNILQAKEVFSRIFSVCNYIDGSPSFVQVVKTALDIMGKPAGVPRYPLLQLSGEDRSELTKVLIGAGLAS